MQLALDNQETDRFPLDLGATLVTGMHVHSVYKLRQALGLDPPGTLVKIIEPFQSLGEINPDLIDALRLALDMVAAAITHIRRGGETQMVVVNFILMALALFVAFGRFVLVPL